MEKFPPPGGVNMGIERLLAVPPPKTWNDYTKIMKENINCEPESFEVDPRDGSYTIFVPGRMKRPQEHEAKVPDNKKVEDKKDCPICQTKTTPVVKLEKISTGYAFVNENLFPIIGPDEIGNPSNSISGLHFLVWPNSNHCKIQDMEPEDYSKTFKLFRDLENDLLMDGIYTNIIKNTGKIAGASLSHEHFQISFCNFMQPTLRRDLDFESSRGESFVNYLLRENSSELFISNTGQVETLIPRFMKRPYDVVLTMSNKNKFGDFSDEDCLNFATEMRRTLKSLSKVMETHYNAPLEYNILIHTGGEMYAEIFPCTQSNGGFERSGVYVCQASPKLCADILKKYS